ncbi:MAG: two-component system, NtrC family, response regulator HydG [Acidobacteriota bacterium]|nr:two-component system, NtrC family, response regulator HydG [Acidobacteriota bacterium]
MLLLGEPGSGRSTVARALHAASRRAAGVLVEVDVASLPSSLFESEIFGYRAGAFTGADRAADGRVARAQGGTLVLDQIEELPLAVQGKLLRLLAERRYAPLGGPEVEADVRFVAIASEDLLVRVARGAFRQDLFYRLEVLAFRLPPLRERQADLPAIADHLLADLGERFGRPGLRVAPAALAWFRDYPWPGNLRELRNILERCLVLSTAGPHEPVPPLDPVPPQGAIGAGESRPRPLLEVEKDEIRRALAYTRGNQRQAAELLGISRKALWEKRKRYGIP